ncbi:MAG: DUF2778 domain-containing protein [Hyphomicrobiales bacterium]|nr:MAG: DUF2778 domain-containing protein [Hyphomicrobiales bacterium]
MSGFWMLGQGAPGVDSGNTSSATAGKASSARVARQQAPAYSGLLDPALSGGKATSFAQGAPARSAFQPAAQPPPSSLAALAPAEPALPLPPQPPVTLAEKAAPMPVPRPLDLLPKLDPQQPQQIQPRVAQPTTPRRNRTAAAAPTPEDNRNFFEKLFGVQKQAEPAGTALAYAAPQDDIVDRGRITRLSPSLGTPPRTAEAGTAIYDIAAKMVYMPNGERLEAHSGFGEMMDDVRYAHVRMKGVTPPHTYTLTEREALFHGVRAIRLNPVGGSGAIHGRAGLLAHTYLLGPRGDSNGCISFKDYDSFLQAFLRGEVKRIRVVASL